MDSSDLDGLIDKLERMVRFSSDHLDGRTVTDRYALLGGDTICDWRPAWEKAREIQAAFNAGVRYPSKDDREQAWIRFNNVRNKLSKRANADRDTLRAVSTSWRDKIIEDLEGARYVTMPIIDELMPTTVEDMKLAGQRVKEVRQTLHENAHQMLREHKDECYALAEEIKQSHDRFWQQYHEGREERRQAHVNSMKERLEKIEQNIERNLEKRQRAEDALARAEENIEKNMDMISNAYSDEYRQRVERWLEEAIAKRDSIRDSIHRFNEWLEQDYSKKDELFNRIFVRE